MATDEHNITIRFVMESSLIKQLLIVVPHLIVALILMYSFLVVSQQTFYLLISLLIVVSSYSYFTRLYLRRNLHSSIHEIHKDSNDQWYLRLRDKVNHPVEVSGASYSSAFLLLINFTDSDKKRYSALVTKDSVGETLFRKLSVYMKTHQLKF